jgi:Arginyl-tRNA synthetase
MGVAEERDPRSLAEELAEEFPETDLVDAVDVAGPGYLNFHLDSSELLDRTEAQLRSDRMGVEQRDGKVLVEFSSPNLAKPMHIGHLRNNCLGDALHRILDFAGYDALSENYLGDWGTKHGQVIYAYKQFGSREDLVQSPMEHMYDLYVRINQEADEETQRRPGSGPGGLRRATRRRPGYGRCSASSPSTTIWRTTSAWIYGSTG